MQSNHDVLDRVWRISSQSLAAGTLALLLAATLVVTASFPQLPDGLHQAAAQRWLASTANGFGVLGPVLESLQVFQVANSLWLRLLLALCGYHLLLRLAEGATDTWRCLRGREIPPLPAEPHVEEAPLAAPPEGALEQISGSLRAAGYRLARAEQREQCMLLYAVRHPLTTFAPLLLCGGLLAVLVGLLANSVAGWRATNLTLAPGRTVEVPPNSDRQLSLAQVDGPDEGAVSAFILERPGESLRGGFASYLRPYRQGNLWIAQRATGPALAVSAHDEAGRPLLLQTQGDTHDPSETAHMLFTASETEQTFAVPERGLLFRVVSYPALPERAINSPVFLVEAYRAAQPAAAVIDQLVPSEATVEFEGITYGFERSRYAVLETAYQPGLWPLFGGWLAVCTAALLLLGWPKAEIWVTLDAGRGTVTTSTTGAPVNLALSDMRRPGTLGSQAEPVHET